MSLQLGNSDDLIAIANQAALSRLLRAIAMPAGQQFALIIVLCNYESLRQSIKQQLYREIAEQDFPLHLREVVLSPNAKTLLTAIQSELDAIATANQVEKNQGLMVFGLDEVLAIDEVIRSANRVREEFFNCLSFPLVLWVNDEILPKLFRLAPDFNNWSPATIEFQLPTTELITYLQQSIDLTFELILDTTDRKFNALTTSYIQEQEHFQTELSLAWQDLQNRQIKLEPSLTADVEFLLGRTALAANHIELAIEKFNHSLQFWQLEALPTNLQESEASSLQLQRQGVILFHLGLAWRTYAVMHRSEYFSACDRARDCFEKSLSRFKSLQRFDWVAEFINALGEVLHRLGKWQELESIAQEGLELHTASGDAVRLAHDRGLLAAVALQNKDWLGAKQQAQIALQLLDELEVISEDLETELSSDVDAIARMDTVWARRYHYSWYLLMLARSQQQMGEIEAAILNLELAKQRSNHQYEPQIYIEILRELRTLYFKRSNYLEAFHLKQEQRSIEQQYGFRAFIGAGWLEPKRQIINSPTEQFNGNGNVAQEIAASGRETDVKRLIDRIALPYHKLTVIHGQSGVGKSSIIHGGLVPALQKKHMLGDRYILPIVIRTYTDWLGFLHRELQKNREDNLSEVSTLPAAPLNTQALLEQLQQNRDHDLLTVLIFDQFEEFFFTHKDIPHRLTFYEFLKGCLNIDYVKVILSLREDYLHYLLECDRLVNLEVVNNDILSKDIRYYLGDFAINDAKSVIYALTKRAQFELEPALVDVLVQDLAQGTGAVRPIELQVVGAQLQEDKITTLAQYEQLGTNPKETLVQQWLQQVIADCGRENEVLAQQVLFYLTDESGNRPIKTKAALAHELDLAIENLDLVLEVLVDSGLVFFIPESPEDCYQLIHDYLVSFIRKRSQSELLQQLANLTKAPNPDPEPQSIQSVPNDFLSSIQHFFSEEMPRMTANLRSLATSLHRIFLSK